MIYSNFLRVACAAGVLVSCSSCQSGSVVASGSKRAPVAVESVKIYFAAPKKFEVIGLVSSLGKGGFTDQGRMDRAINELKNQAAKIGANGVLLAATGDASGGVVGGFSGGVFYGAPVQMKQASGQAILVSEE